MVKKVTHFSILSILVFLFVCVRFFDPSLADDPISREARGARSFHFVYAASVDDLPREFDRLRIWIPLPSSDENQVISALTVDTTAGFTIRYAHDKVWGNRILYAECSDSSLVTADGVHVRIEFDVTRREATGKSSSEGLPSTAVLMKGSRFAPVNEEVRKRARELSATGGSGEKAARKIYDRVLRDVDYDKSGTGWGQGSISHVCTTGKGNCSDFHSLFIAMAQAEGIASYFEIGLPIDNSKREGVVSGYHCWAWFLDSEQVWRPIDASEADKHPSKADYYFGTIDANRVALSRGRDIVLEPRTSSSSPVNFFIYPVVELDGEPFADGVHTAFHYRDID